MYFTYDEDMDHLSSRIGDLMRVTNRDGWMGRFMSLRPMCDVTMVVGDYLKDNLMESRYMPSTAVSSSAFLRCSNRTSPCYFQIVQNHRRAKYEDEVRYMRNVRIKQGICHGIFLYFATVTTKCMKIIWNIAGAMEAGCCCSASPHLCCCWQALMAQASQSVHSPLGEINNAANFALVLLVNLFHSSPAARYRVDKTRFTIHLPLTHMMWMMNLAEFQ